jgi:hypothetical protein
MGIGEVAWLDEGGRAARMSARSVVRVVGQGLAGTVLAWALERAGYGVELIDRGHAGAASRVGAGLVSPVTGLRWAVAPGWMERARQARECYAAMERAWGRRFITELRIRRFWRDAEEARLVEAKVKRGELSPWVESASLDKEGAWIEGAWRVDLPALIEEGRRQWASRGRLREEVCPEGAWRGGEGPLIWCIGSEERRLAELVAVEGETLDLTVSGGSWDPAVVRHDGVWVLPLGAGRAWAGASFVREESERVVRREALRRSVRRLLAELTWAEAGVLAGRRMSSHDRRPRSDWLPGATGREGVLNGLGSKGALWAPALAEEWVQRLERLR